MWSLCSIEKKKEKKDDPGMFFYALGNDSVFSPRKKKKGEGKKRGEKMFTPCSFYHVGATGRKERKKSALEYLSL